MARSQLLLAVTRLPSASAALARALLRSAVFTHSRCHDSSSVKSMRLTVSQHSETVAPPAWAAANNLMNPSERSSRSGQAGQPSEFMLKLATGAVCAREKSSSRSPSSKPTNGGNKERMRSDDPDRRAQRAHMMAHPSQLLHIGVELLQRNSLHR